MLKVDSSISLAWVGWLDIEKVDSLILLASFPLLFLRGNQLQEAMLKVDSLILLGWLPFSFIV